MKRKDLLDLLDQNGIHLVRNGGNHDIYEDANNVRQPIPRHTEISENLAKKILKRWGI